MTIKLQSKTEKNLIASINEEAAAQEAFLLAQEKLQSASRHKQALLESIYEQNGIDYIDELPQGFQLSLNKGVLTIPDRPVKASTRIKSALKKADQVKPKMKVNGKEKS